MRRNEFLQELVDVLGLMNSNGAVSMLIDCHTQEPGQRPKMFRVESRRSGELTSEPREQLRRIMGGNYIVDVNSHHHDRALFPVLNEAA